ncbi:MAG: hypothetical protein H6707_13475 [Deltaproteobacteria bacterium]|nr:hypothetical protein [Deltaproteobacteria bacterium]
MTMRRINLILCLIVVAVAVARFATGNVIGGLVASAVAVVLGSLAAEYPLFSRLNRVARFLWRRIKRRL